MAEKAGFEGEGEVEFRSPGKVRDARDEGFQETCRTCQDSNKTPKQDTRRQRNLRSADLRRRNAS
jgi:hypothetical protein